MEFSELERSVIRMILAKPLPGMDILREQFAAASVVDRDYTGPGFYTKIAVPRSLPAAPESVELSDQLLGGAGGRRKSDPSSPIDFLLRTDAGYLVCLEGKTLESGEPWPDEDDIEVIPTMLERGRRGSVAKDRRKPHDGY